MEIDGYFADTPYPPHLPPAFTPAWIDHVLRHRGYRPRRAPRGPFRYLDLGCGNGVQLIIMAAGCPEGHFIGTDANGPAIARAAVLAEGLGVGNVTFRAETFAETLAGAEPGFDYVTGLGLLSWVSAENRALLYRIAGRALAPSGAAAFGYNTLPGRAGELVLHRMLLEAARAHDGPQSEAIVATFDRLAALAEAGAPGLRDGRLARLLAGRDKLSGQFLPHEYMSEHWAPLQSADVIRALDAEGLDFAGSLTLLENRRDFLLGRAVRELVEAEAEIAARERLVDIVTDQDFRRDLYVRRPSSASDTRKDRDAAWIALSRPTTGVELVMSTPSGRLRFDNRATRSILAALETGPKTVAEAGTEVARGDRLNALDALMAAGLVVSVEPPAEVDAAPLNRWLAERAARGEPAPMAQATRFGPRALPSVLMQALGTGTASRVDRARYGL